MTGLEIERRENVPIARAREDIDAASARRLGEELTESLSGAAGQLVLDLSDTRHVDSAGIEMLFRLSERLRQRRAKLLLVIPPGSNLLRLVEIVGLPRTIPVYDSVEQALEGCATGER